MGRQSESRGAVRLEGNGRCRDQNLHDARYKSPEHWIDVFRTYYGPMVKTFAAIDADARAALEADLHASIDEFDLAEDGTHVVPGESLEVVVTKKR